MHPVVEAWFGETYGTPTDIQERVWPVIAQGSHTLFTAPTGSGKTLAAFLYSIDRLLTRQWDSGRVTVLYVSPLKALNNDIRRNLTGPLEELTERFTAGGHDPPAIHARTRSGDTPSEERRRMLRHPPEILITTPESLNILLTSKSGRALLSSVQKIILDEIHAIAATKRGTHLMTAVERVDALSEYDMQRIAISATARPLDVIARFVAGYSGDGRERPINVVKGAADHRVELSVEYADPLEQLRSAQDEADDPSPWVPVIERLRAHLKQNRSTLIFTTNRRDAEKVAALLNEAEGRMCAYPHHGSLSLELRRQVESRMKTGSLEAVVATTSLELG
ncbi:MAG: DEAD/DEAH box helicase, partial [Spirochaetes bacterium]|nr:DEAD/DEAH box helicase [Spirochaetota bacterium]